MNEERDALTERVIGLAIGIHKALGPGLLESPYHECLAYDLTDVGLYVQKELLIPITYKKLVLPDAFRIDLLIKKRLIVEVKAVEKILPVHEAQLLTYLRMMGIRTGLLLNFNVPGLRDGIKRMVL